MDKARMRYPESSVFETRRQRDNRLALQRSVAREAQHADQFGAPTTPEPQLPVAVVSPRGITMPLETFQGADYGQVCHLLRLRPSQPHRTAEGRDARKRSRRRPSAAHR